MMTSALPLIVAVVGVLMYALAPNGKISRIGEIMFFVGLFWLVQTLSTRVVHF